MGTQPGKQHNIESHLLKTWMNLKHGAAPRPAELDQPPWHSNANHPLHRIVTPLGHAKSSIPFRRGRGSGWRPAADEANEPQVSTLGPRHHQLFLLAEQLEGFPYPIEMSVGDTRTTGLDAGEKEEHKVTESPVLTVPAAVTNSNSALGDLLQRSVRLILTLTGLIPPSVIWVSAEREVSPQPVTQPSPLPSSPGKGHCRRSHPCSSLPRQHQASWAQNPEQPLVHH